MRASPNHGLTDRNFMMPRMQTQARGSSSNRSGIAINIAMLLEPL
jgi:hypothetical protein